MSAGPLKEDHIRRYMEAKGVSFKCEACGHDQFDCFDEYEEGHRFGLSKFKSGSGLASELNVAEIVYIECKHCHAIRLHNRAPLIAWVADNIEEPDED